MRTRFPTFHGHAQALTFIAIYRTFENNWLAVRGGLKAAAGLYIQATTNFLLVDPTVSQRWFDANGSYQDIDAAPEPAELEEAAVTVMAFRRPDDHWVMVVMIKAANVKNPTNQLRYAFILNTSSLGELLDVEQVVKKLYKRIKGPPVFFCYPDVSFEQQLTLADDES